MRMTPRPQEKKPIIIVMDYSSKRIQIDSGKGIDEQSKVQGSHMQAFSRLILVH